MKKSIRLVAVAMLAMFGFASCDENGFHLNLDSDVLGKIDVVASNPQAGTLDGTQYYADGDTATFGSSLSHVTYSDTSVTDFDVAMGTVVMVGMEKDITHFADDSDIEFPLVGLNLRDTLTGDHLITCPLRDISFFDTAKELYGDGENTNWMMLITRGNETFGHMFVLATDSLGMYIGYEGNIHISKFQSMGKLVEGTLENVKAAYVTFDEVERLYSLPEAERATIGDLTLYFPTITFNGTIKSRRANMSSLISALENQ